MAQNKAKTGKAAKPCPECSKLRDVINAVSMQLYLFELLYDRLEPLTRKPNEEVLSDHDFEVVVESIYIGIQNIRQALEKK